MKRLMILLLGLMTCLQGWAGASSMARGLQSHERTVLLSAG